jgi:hypothetical protein
MSRNVHMDDFVQPAIEQIIGGKNRIAVTRQVASN